MNATPRSAPETISVITRTPARRRAFDPGELCTVFATAAVLTGLHAGHALTIGGVQTVLWFLGFCAVYLLLCAGDWSLSTVRRRRALNSRNTSSPVRDPK